jgi:hypothetical protein
MKRLLFPTIAVTALCACLAPAACSLRRGARLAPLPPAATEALAEARELARVRPDGWRAGARQAAERAAAAAPEWTAPQRVLDDLGREELLGHELLAARTAALAPDATAAELYLAGRLEGRPGAALLERAARLDPALAWAQHGLAWQHFQAGQTRAALHAGRRAVELARGSYELGYFAGAEVRYLLELGRFGAARERLEEVLADERLAEPERTELELALARAELADDDPELVERGFWRAVALLEHERLARDEYDELGREVLARRALAGLSDPLAVLLAALEHGQGEGRARLRARVLMERGDRALAGAALARAEASSAPGLFQRAYDLERGAARVAIERWREALPARLRDAQGLPLEPVLRALVLAARAADGSQGALEHGAIELGQALLDAGWFVEAEAWASSLARRNGAAAPAAALELGARAAAGQALLTGVRGVLEHVDEERAALVPGARGHRAHARAIEDLDGLLAAVQPFFERFHGAPLEHDLATSPRLSFGAFASIVHPGPRFSRLDQDDGRGTEGESVPGLAAELLRIGRFGIFGQAPGGGGPDGTVLRLVGGEWKSGEHLGVPFSGWVAWCEGADIQSRPGRNGAGVSGAALHEGYWVDLESVRADWERLRALQRQFLSDGTETLERALAGRGPRLTGAAGADERARWMTPLGEGERVLLSALREREPAADGGRIPFEELLEVTALHEEGHLTDRTRFLPLARKWPKAIGFLLRHGFTPRAVARALEYRAQLVALCEADEPRLVLAECLSAADSEGGALAHGEAYRLLLDDFLEVVAAELEHLSALDARHYLVYQLHFLGRDDVRKLARELARRQGMLAD